MCLFPDGFLIKRFLCQAERGKIAGNIAFRVILTLLIVAGGQKRHAVIAPCYPAVMRPAFFRLNLRPDRSCHPQRIQVHAAGKILRHIPSFHIEDQLVHLVLDVQAVHDIKTVPVLCTGEGSLKHVQGQGIFQFGPCDLMFTDHERRRVVRIFRKRTQRTEEKYQDQKNGSQLFHAFFLLFTSSVTDSLLFPLSESCAPREAEEKTADGFRNLFRPLLGTFSQGQNAVLL